MAQFVVNWDEIELGPVLIDPGIYDATIEAKGVPLEPTQDGSPSFRISFHVHLPDGRTVRLGRRYVLSERARWAVKELWVAAGLPASGTERANTDLLHGRKVRVEIVQTEYEREGTRRVSSQIGRVFPPASANTPTPTNGGTEPVAGAAAAPAQARQIDDAVLKKLLGA